MVCLSTTSNLSSSPPGEYLADSIRFVHSMWTSPSTPCGLLRDLRPLHVDFTVTSRQHNIEYLIRLIMAAHFSVQLGVSRDLFVDPVKSFLLTSMVGYPTVTSWQPVTSRQHNIDLAL